MGIVFYAWFNTDLSWWPARWHALAQIPMKPATDHDVDGDKIRLTVSGSPAITFR